MDKNTDKLEVEGTTFNPPERHQRTKKRKSKVMVSKTTGEITFIGEPPPEDWIPEGWSLVGGNRWVPQWPACQYRKMSVFVPTGQGPQFKIKCSEESIAKDEKTGLKVIDAPTCIGCKLYQAKQHAPRVAHDEGAMRELFARDFPDIVHKEDAEIAGRQIQYMSEHPFSGYDESELDQIEEALFDQAMGDLPDNELNKYHPRNRRQSQFKWGIPCLDRIKVLKNKDNPEDCAGCGEYSLVCNNPNAEWYEKKVTRKKCAGCPCPTPLEQRFTENNPGPPDDRRTD